jgi:hypothetical protein
MTELAYKVRSYTAYHIDEVAVGPGIPMISLSILDNYEHTGAVHVVDMTEIIGIGLINIQNRKCIRIVYPSTRSLTVLYACDEDTYSTIAGLVNTYKRNIKCNGDI